MQNHGVGNRTGARAELLAASLLTLLLVGVLAPPFSHGAWTAPVNLSGANQNASKPQVAVDADGDAVFTWERFDGAHWRIQARVRSAAGVRSAVQTLSKSGQDANSPQVAVDDAGDAVFTWSRSDGANARVQVRARDATTGNLSAVQDLSDPGQNAFAPQVAVDADGDAVFTWALDVGASPQLAQARARSAAGALSAVQDLSDSGSDALSPFPQVGVDDGGDAVFTWERSDGTNLQIQTRARSAAGGLSAVQDLGQSAFIDVHRLGVDADGDAVYTWVRRDGTTNCGGFGCLRAQAQARSAAGTLSAVQTLSKGGQDANSPQVAVDDAGDAVFTWSRSDGLNDRVQARARDATTATLSAVQTLSDPGQNAFAPQVAVDAGGDAVFSWARFDGTVPDPDLPCCARIQAMTRSAAGTLSGVQTLSKGGQDAFNPQVGVDVAGNAVATWHRFDGTNDRIQASAGP